MDPDLRAYLTAVRRARDDAVAAAPAAVATHRTVATVAATVADELGMELAPACRLAGVPPLAALGRLRPPSGHAGPALLGAVHLALTTADERRTRGAHYTPAAVARILVERTLAEIERAPHGAPAVCDPAVGGGAFLLAAADHLADLGVARRHVVDACLFGADVDPLAVAVTEAALALWAGDGRPPPPGRLLVGDGLGLTPADWAAAPPAGFDAVVGNPPFLGQLARSTARSRADRARTATRFGEGRRAYTDTAGLFLLAALEMVRPGGALCLVQPESVLAARDSAGVREILTTRGSLRAMWLGGADIFDAGVRVCAPVIAVGRGQGPPVEVLGADGKPRSRTAPLRLHCWSGLLAEAEGVPDVSAAAVGSRLGDSFHATAGFRDEYYGLVGHVAERRDDPDGTPLVTTGAVDPGICHWGRRPLRFAGTTWDAPVVDRSGLADDSRVAAWLRRVLVPKVVVAPQTKVVEAAVDETGEWVPSTPLIAVMGPPPRLWHVAAALCGPVASAWAAREAAGTGLAGGTVRLRAGQVLGAPLPPDGPHLERAVTALRAAATASDGESWRAAMLEVGAATCRSHGLTDEGLLAWWVDRLPAWR